MPKFIADEEMQNLCANLLLREGSRTEAWRGSLFPEDSPYKKRIEEIGFQFNKIHLETDGHTVTMRGSVLCQCGQTEHFTMAISMQVINYAFRIPDMYENLMPNFSPEHLVEDGFPDEVVQRARQIWAKPLQHPQQTQPVNGFDYGVPGSDALKWKY